MPARSLRLAAAVAALFVAPIAAEASVVTTGFSIGYSVGQNGVSRFGATSNARFAYVGGNATTSTNNTFPSFVVYEVDGAGVLNQFRAAINNSTGTVTSINSLSLKLYDESPVTGSTAGGFDFSYATNATPLTIGSLTPAYDSTDTGGLTTQLGATIGLGSGTYTPAGQNVALPTYSIGSTTGNAAILAAINAGQTFRLVIDANTTTTKATLSGYNGLSSGTTVFITPPSLTIDADAVPEPASLGLAAVAAAGLLGRRRSAGR